MSELKPCPFCGGEAVVTLAGVSCTKCPGTVVVDFNATDQDAINAWNTRAERTCKQNRLFNLVSRGCDGEYYQWHDKEMPNYCPNCGAKVVEQ